MKILVTGGAGYIGSHTCVALIAAGHQIVIFDNLINSHPEVINRLATITGQDISFINGDIRDQAAVEEALRTHGCEAVIHFAGLKAVGESVTAPLMYYDNNVTGTLSLLSAMKATGVSTLVFSSSATVYGQPQFLPYTEQHPLAPINPYGRTKLMVEHILHDFHQAHADWKIAILRYFNPAGAHPSGLIGEDPSGIPNNLMPFVAQVAGGRRERLSVWGNDYETPDGTGVRDYIHVMDLASGHVAALQHLMTPQCLTVNLGTGTGYSVLDVIKAFESACGHTIPYSFCPRRPGDMASYYSDPSLAHTLLGWRAVHTLEEMCQDSWKWQTSNPQGYV